MSEFLTIEDLSKEFPQVFPTPNAVYVRASRAPESLPPRIVLPGVRKMIFRRQAVVDWLVSHEVQSAPALAPAPAPAPEPNPPKRKRGRPTKAEQLAAREADKPC